MNETVIDSVQFQTGEGPQNTVPAKRPGDDRRSEPSWEERMGIPGRLSPGWNPQYRRAPDGIEELRSAPSICATDALGIASTIVVRWMKAARV